jgi:Na+-driven multidrug efflux pump
MITAERPRLSLAVTLIAGGLNMLLDLLLVGILGLGL